MIGVPRGVSVYAYAKACDMRKSFNTLAAIVTEELKHDVLTGDLYLFVSRDRKRAKVLYFDGTGVCLLPSAWSTANSLPCGSERARRRSSSLGLFIEGSDAFGKVPLSPPLLRKADLRVKFPEKSVAKG